MVKADMSIQMVNEAWDLETIQKADNQEEARYLCDEWLEEELTDAEIDFNEITIERTDGYEFQVQVWDGGFNLIGDGNILIEKEAHHGHE